MKSDFSKIFMEVIFSEKRIKKKINQNLFLSRQNHTKTSMSQTSHEVSEAPTQTVPAHEL